MRRERFLAEMDAVIPWERLLALIEPHDPKAGNGAQPEPMQQTPRIDFMQNWFNLSDPRPRNSYDIESTRRFAGIELLGHDIPDESTILRLRDLLEEHELTQRILAEICTLLLGEAAAAEVWDHRHATLIAARPRPIRAQGARPRDAPDPQGQAWHFGMRRTSAGDPRGIEHSLATTDAAAKLYWPAAKVCTGRKKSSSGTRPTGASFIVSAPRLSAVCDRVSRRGTRRSRSPSIRSSSTAAARVSRAPASMPSCGQAPVGLCRRRATAACQEHGPSLFPPLEHWRNWTCLRRRRITPQGTCHW